MKKLILNGSLAALTLVGVLANSPSLQAAEPATDADKLFNGTDLTGWEGHSELWSVEDGQIVGRTTDENPIKQNTFLIYKGELPSDFELVAEFKIEAGNSGIQYRSKVLDETEFVVGGYQADIDFGNTFAGILYEEKGRGILAQRGEKSVIGSDGKIEKSKFADGKELGNGIHPGKWNEFRVVAKGNHLQHFINGALVSETIDEQEEKAAKTGVIALQLHKGPAMVVRFKNLVLEGT